METKEIRDDWRLTNQEKYLKNVEIRRHKYKKYSELWEHDHCDFCMKKFKEDCQQEKNCTNIGYSTLDNYYWICDKCFEDFKDIFQWKVVETD